MPCEEKVDKYGVPARTPPKMRAILNIIVNQTSWYYSCTFNDPVPTKVVTLCLANTYSSSVSADEKEMAEAFQAILKNGANNPVIKQALLCHLMAGEHRLEMVVATGKAIGLTRLLVLNKLWK